jgi:hypothetical protein
MYLSHKPVAQGCKKAYWEPCDVDSDLGSLAIISGQYYSSKNNIISMLVLKLIPCMNRCQLRNIKMNLRTISKWLMVT